MDWATIKPALVTLLASLSGIPENQVIWRDQKRPHFNTTIRAQLVLKVTPTNALGVDQMRYEYQAGPDKNVPTQSGNRKFVLQVRCETFSHKDTESATFYLEEIRNSLKFASTIAALAAIDVSIAKAESVVDLSENQQVNSKVFSLANLDLHMNGVANKTDTNDPGDYISSTEVEGTIDTLTDVDVTTTLIP
jgi:hypothetical protein